MSNQFTDEQNPTADDPPSAAETEQKANRTTSDASKALPPNDDEGLEREADVMG